MHTCRLSRRGEAVLAAAAAVVLAKANKAMGVTELAAVMPAPPPPIPDAPAPDPYALPLTPAAAVAAAAAAAAAARSQVLLSRAAAKANRAAVAAAEAYAALDASELVFGQDNEDDDDEDVEQSAAATAAAAAAAAASLVSTHKADKLAWNAFCSGCTAVATTHSAASLPTTTTDVSGSGAQAADSSSSGYSQRLPQLLPRLAKVLTTSLFQVPPKQATAIIVEGAEPAGPLEVAPDGAEVLDDLAVAVAQRAVALRGDITKGARSRKKKAVTDALKSLSAAGVSRRVADVPAGESESPNLCRKCTTPVACVQAHKRSKACRMPLIAIPDGTPANSLVYQSELLQSLPPDHRTLLTPVMQRHCDTQMKSTSRVHSCTCCRKHRFVASFPSPKQHWGMWFPNLITPLRPCPSPQHSLLHLAVLVRSTHTICAPSKLQP